MPRLFPRSGKPPAQAPGTLTFTGEKKVERVQIQQTVFGPESIDEATGFDLPPAEPQEVKGRVHWLDVQGLHDTDLIARIGERFGLHPLVLEDIAHPQQRPKIEDYDDHLYIVVRRLSFSVAEQRLTSEQVSLVVGPDFLLTFQERSGDGFEAVCERLRRGRGRIRTSGPGYLAYALLDAVIDHYFKVLEDLDEALEQVEYLVLDRPTEEVLQRIHLLKREMVLLRRVIWPVREVVNRLERAESPLMDRDIAPFLRDLQDHVLHLAETVDAFRDILSGLQDLYLSSISNRMNDVMKVLTIFASIFVPLTFIAGVYGMNFQHMPELAWRWSYPVFWGVILLVAVALLVFFRRRKWI